ncbi:MAG: tRNA (adenosine(37)-N6)-dimethylallyltransferase MiaA [Patescibacteria group bacterium]
MNKVLVIVGSTASGKSDLAIKLALKFNGEIISADSRQVYRGLNIATGKITKKETRGISHYCLNIADPKERFTVLDWKKEAEKAITDILARGKLPIICGGTGFYVDAIVNNTDFPPVGANNKLRAKLAMKSIVELFALLKRLDSIRLSRMNESDKKNPRRLIRAIEIAKSHKSNHSKKNKNSKTITRPRSKYNCQFIGIDLPKEELKERIRARTVNRIDRGMVEEARRLHSKGLSFKRMREIGLEYKYLADFLENKMTKEQLIETIITKDWQYARRQMTWWRRDGRIHWFHCENSHQIIIEISDFIKIPDIDRTMDW